MEEETKDDWFEKELRKSMVEEEFNLSKKIIQMGNEGMTYPMLDPKDIKEFIKLLKEDKYSVNCECCEGWRDTIDKLAGEDLV